ncbi:MAG: hypothetical protein VX899_18970 [Myxococcota bacterium]|nr:hypothetical protein [Myxococcota bacterium]
MAETLQIPSGAQLSVEDGKVALVAEGDIVLEGPIRGSLARLESKGGSVLLRGPLQIDHVTGDSVRIEGHLVCKSVTARGGSLQMRGRLDAEEAEAIQGDVVVRGPTQVGTLRAGATLRVDGPRVEAQLMTAPLIRFRGGTVKARGVEARERVSLGPCAFTIEVCIAPHADVDPKAAGRVNVLESFNELASNALKGRFRLQEYAEFTGIDPESFLRERHVRPLAELGGAKAVAADGDNAGLDEAALREADEPTHKESAPTLVDQNSARGLLAPADEEIEEFDPLPQIAQAQPVEQPEVLELSDESSLDEPTAPDHVVSFHRQPDAPEPAREEIEPFDDFDAGDTLDGESNATLAPPDAPTLNLDGSQQAMLDTTVARLVKRYQGGEPPAITRLRALVNNQEYGVVREELKDLFNSVVRGHIASGTRPHPEVLSSFNAIHEMMKHA